MMAFEHEIEALAATRDAQRRQGVLARLKLFWRRDTIHSYRRVFTDGNGRVTPAGARVIADIAEIAKLGVADLATLTEAQLRERAGRRQLALHIIARIDLDGAGLRDIATKLKEHEA